MNRLNISSSVLAAAVSYITRPLTGASRHTTLTGPTSTIIKAYNADRTHLNYNDTAYGLVALKRVYPWLKEADSIALQQSLRHLDTAFLNFFRVKGSGFPKFKSSKHNRKSYTTINQNGTVLIMDDKHLRLPKAGTTVCPKADG